MVPSQKNLGFEHIPKGPSSNKNKKEQQRVTSGTPLVMQQGEKKEGNQDKSAKEKKKPVTSTGIPSRKDRFTTAIHKQTKIAERKTMPATQKKRPVNWRKVQCYGC